MKNIFQNIDLQELSKLESFDKITHFVCTQSRLLDLKSILEFYLVNRNFISLDYCDSQANKKLISICEKYKNLNNNSLKGLPLNENEKPEIIQTYPNYSLETLVEIENLGTRVQNVCKTCRFNSLKDIVYYYLTSATKLLIKKPTNCVIKTYTVIDS